MRVLRLLAVAGLAMALGGGVQSGATADPVAAAAPPSSFFTPLSPARVLDTRNGTGTGGTTTPVGPGSTITLDLSARLPATTTAVVLNITGTQPTATTFVIVHPNGVARPDTSNLSVAPGETRAVLTTTAVLPDRKLLIYNNLGSTHVVADLTGYYATDTGEKYRSVPPTRMLDTRINGGPIGTDRTRSVDLSAHVPAGTTAVAFNLTGTNPTAWTYVTAFPHGETRPSTSNLNLIRAGQTSPNLVVLKIGPNRTVDLYNNLGDVDLIVDLAGYYGTAGDSTFVPVNPKRTFDTRTGLGAFGRPASPLGQAESASLDVTRPFDDTNVVVFSLTGTAATSTTYIGVVDANGGPPTTSALNLVPGQTSTNLVMTPSSGSVRLYNNLGSTHLIGDVVGFFTRGCTGTSGCAYSWGINTQGQLGDGTDVYLRGNPKPVFDLPDVTAIAAGYDHVVALQANGKVSTWGSIAQTPWLGHNRPVPVPDLSGVTAIAAGAHNALALKSDDTVWAWGSGTAGALGDGGDHGSTVVTTPVRVSGLTEVVALASGRHVQYALRADGTVWAWGTNSRGQLGNGVTCPTPQDPTSCTSNVPVQVSGLTGVKAISEDGFAVKHDGTVWTWGSNNAGLLGIGKQQGSYNAVEPVRVTALANVVQIVGSNANRFALTSDGAIWAWGSNAEGQIGNGTMDGYLTTPTAVSPIAGVVGIASGESHNGYAVTSDGSVWSWGSNINGQLGVPDTSLRRSLVPMKVPNITSAIGVTGYSMGAIALVRERR